MSVFDSIKESIDKAVDTASGIPPESKTNFWGGNGDLDAVLAEKADAKGEKLNYKTSIVDLFKTLDLDSSLDNRKALASELGYTGALDGSAEMNIWLHKATMDKLAANGAQVPESMKD